MKSRTDYWREYARRRRLQDGVSSKIDVTVPTAPIVPHLTALIARHGSQTAAVMLNVHRRELYRVIESERITVRRADQLACAIGCHPFEIWGEKFYEGTGVKFALLTGPISTAQCATSKTPAEVFA